MSIDMRFSLYLLSLRLYLIVYLSLFRRASGQPSLFPRLRRGPRTWDRALVGYCPRRLPAARVGV